MEVLVTGASGFLGSHIAEQLSHEGHRVRAIVRKSSNITFLNSLEHIKLIDISLDNKDALKEAVKGVDAIIHSAALVKARSEAEFNRVNCSYTLNLLDAAETTLDTLKRFVLVSSLAATGPSPNGQVIGNDKIATPVTRYGRSKLAADLAAKNCCHRIPITILRPVSLYGPRDRGILSFFKSINYRVIPYFGSIDTRIMLLYGADCASACIRAIDANVPSGATYLLDDGHVSTWREVMHLLETVTGKRAIIRFPIPRLVMQGIAGIMDFISLISGKSFMLSSDKLNELYGEFVTDSSEAQQALEWKPKVKLEKGLSLTLDWYRKNKWL